MCMCYTRNSSFEENGNYYMTGMSMAKTLLVINSFPFIDEENMVANCDIVVLRQMDDFMLKYLLLLQELGTNGYVPYIYCI